PTIVMPTPIPQTLPSTPTATPVVQTTLATPLPPKIDDRDWQGHLTSAIAALEKENESPPTSAAEIGRHAALRMLYLLDGRRDEAMRSIVGIPPGQQDFWSKQLYALAVSLDSERNPDTSRRAAEVAV